jgi:16S rRNA (guanine966-N2)-methyltransferase
MPRKKNTTPNNAYPGRIRIVAGIWRNRFLKVANLENLRPTSERIRETLFNWLAPDMENARCLDLFAGTGSLGFEALSRGASSVTFVEKSKIASKLLQDAAKLLEAENINIFNQEAQVFLKPKADQRYSLVFLDPPFGDKLLSDIIAFLHHGNWLSVGAKIYVELEINQDFPVLPEGWVVTHKKNIGKVCFALLKVM